MNVLAAAAAFLSWVRSQYFYEWRSTVGDGGIGAAVGVEERVIRDKNTLAICSRCFLPRVAGYENTSSR